MLPEQPYVDGGFDRVYEVERPAIVRLAFLLVRSQSEAEELAQEAFLRLYASFESVNNPAGFVRTVVVRLALSSVIAESSSVSGCLWWVIAVSRRTETSTRSGRPSAV